MSQNTYFYAFTVVFLAGIFWSFGALTVRYMVDGHAYVFQYLFYRGFSISIILLLYLFFTEGFSFYKNFLKIGISSVLGGLFLATAFTGFIFSITMTTAAVTLFMLAAMPFIAAIVGYFVLGEILKRSTLVAMIVAFIGVCVMIVNDSISGTALGAIIGFLKYIASNKTKPKPSQFEFIQNMSIFFKNLPISLTKPSQITFLLIPSLMDKFFNFFSSGPLPAITRTALVLFILVNCLILLKICS